MLFLAVLIDSIFLPDINIYSMPMGIVQWAFHSDPTTALNVEESSKDCNFLTPNQELLLKMNCAATEIQ